MRSVRAFEPLAASHWSKYYKINYYYSMPWHSFHTIIITILFRLIFLGIYAIELVIKLIARGGALHQFAYLRDPWNWLDLIILIAG